MVVWRIAVGLADAAGGAGAGGTGCFGGCGAAGGGAVVFATGLLSWRQEIIVPATMKMDSIGMMRRIIGFSREEIVSFCRSYLRLSACC
jgi:hypothetical protein